jgi:acyl dehydratase
VSAKPFRYWFEDFAVGMALEIPGPVLTPESIMEFARRYDPQPFHVDEQAAKQSAYGGLIASGWHTVSLPIRMICDAYLLDAASLGSPGVNEVRWLKPVRPGDAIRLRMTVLEAKPSKSKPDRGTVILKSETRNQRGEAVQILTSKLIVPRRPGAAAGPS